MPGVCGFEAAGEILRLTPVPVVLMSGDWDSGRRGRAENLSVPCIAKPFGMGGLIRTTGVVIPMREAPGASPMPA